MEVKRNGKTEEERINDKERAEHPKCYAVHRLPAMPKEYS